MAPRTSPLVPNIQIKKGYEETKENQTNTAK